MTVVANELHPLNTSFALVKRNREVWLSTSCILTPPAIGGWRGRNSIHGLWKLQLVRTGEWLASHRTHATPLLGLRMAGPANWGPIAVSSESLQGRALALR